MRPNTTLPSPAGPMHFATAAAFACAVALAAFASPARADSPVPSVLPAIGKTLHYRITRTAQGNTGPKIGVSNVTLRRKSATLLTLQGVFDRPSVLTALTVGAGGELAIPDDAKVARDASSLGDVVDGLNRLTKFFTGKKTVPHDGWSASIPLPDVRGATGPVAIPIAVENVSTGSFELHGVGELTVEAQAATSPTNVNLAAQQRAARMNRFRGGAAFGPAGFAGGALPAGGLPGNGPIGETSAAGRQQVTVAVSVDGRIRHGAIAKIAMVETRSVTVDALPFVNVSGWTIESTK